VFRTAETDFEGSYYRVLWSIAAVAIIGHMLLFVFGPDMKVQAYRLAEKPKMEAVQIPDNFNVPPPPEEAPKPEVPTDIAPSDAADADATMGSTELNVDAPPELPPGPKRAEFFTAFDEPPQVIKQVKPVYPDMARQAELEGVVLLLVGVDEFGNVIEVTVLQSVAGLDQAAIDAVYKWKFKPAKQRDVPVAVRISLPVRFSLTG